MVLSRESEFAHRLAGRSYGLERVAVPKTWEEIGR
jgi:hypothetical protein